MRGGGGVGGEVGEVEGVGDVEIPLKEVKKLGRDRLRLVFGYGLRKEEMSMSMTMRMHD